MTLELISSSSPAPHPVEDHDRPPGLAARVVTALIVGIPFLALVFGVIRVWGRGIHVGDVLLAAVFYVLVGHGMTIGFHRLLAPDTASDPHTPQCDDGGVRGQVKGSWHAHLGWLLGGTLGAAFSALVWAGLVRICVLHDVTWSVNSLCHMFGRRPFATNDRSSNVAALAVLSMGESWLNGHHAVPRSARHGRLRGQWDSSAMLIRASERMALLHDVQWPSAQAVRNRRISVGGQRGLQHRANAGGS